ncbi:MAG: polysaccharide export protein [Pirellulales bacterium]|nr:polysaccharide export protein [Pirellulales bacterium]
MPAHLTPRSCRALALARSARLWIACTLLAPAAGCTTGGSLFPNDHRLLPAAKDVAAVTRPSDPRELCKHALEAFYVQPGDVLLLEVIDLQADVRLPADQTVMPDGTIDLGQYGRIVVAGMTIEQIEVAVTAAVQALHPDQSIKPINVRLNVAESAVYYVLGEVNAPGAYPLIGRETVLDGICTAGGLSDRASECQIILSRPTPPNCCRIVLPVCYDRIVQLGDTTTNYQLRPGDRIYVGTRTCWEALRFWKHGCDNCPDGARACRCTAPAALSPFCVQQPHVQGVAEPSELPAPAIESAPAPDVSGPSVSHERPQIKTASAAPHNPFASLLK